MNTSRVSALHALGAAVALLFLGAAPAGAQQDGPARILKAMSEYVGSQKNITVLFDSDIEVVTPDFQKIQFNSSGQLTLSRPDKVRVSRTGGYSDIELVFDGTTTTLFGKNLGKFAQVRTPGTVADLAGLIRDQLSLDLPGADLFAPGCVQAIDAYGRIYYRCP